jgi:uncharacterized membrane protein YhdT
MKTGTRLAIILFTLVAVAHLLRVVYAVPVTVGIWEIPVWASLLGIIVPVLVAAMLWSERN